MRVIEQGAGLSQRKLAYDRSDSSIGWVIQGPLKSAYRRQWPALTPRGERCLTSEGWVYLVEAGLLEQLKRFRSTASRVVVVTDEEHVGHLAEHLKTLGVALLQLRFEDGIQNIEKQLLGVHAGIDFLEREGCRYILKSRTDQVIDAESVIADYRNCRALGLRADSVLVAHSRSPFNVADVFVFGRTEAMRYFWGSGCSPSQLLIPDLNGTTIHVYLPASLLVNLRPEYRSDILEAVEAIISDRDLDPSAVALWECLARSHIGIARRSVGAHYRWRGQPALVLGHDFNRQWLGWSCGLRAGVTVPSHSRAEARARMQLVRWLGTALVMRAAGGCRRRRWLRTLRECVVRFDSWRA